MENHLMQVSWKEGRGKKKLEIGFEEKL